MTRIGSEHNNLAFTPFYFFILVFFRLVAVPRVARKRTKTNLYSDSNGTRINCFFPPDKEIKGIGRRAAATAAGVRAESNLVYGRGVPVPVASLWHAFIVLIRRTSDPERGNTSRNRRAENSMQTDR